MIASGKRLGRPFLLEEAAVMLRREPEMTEMIEIVFGPGLQDFLFINAVSARNKMRRVVFVNKERKRRRLTGFGPNKYLLDRFLILNEFV